MLCPRCEHSNRPEAVVCQSCGAGLQQACLSCGCRCPVSARFCSECGARLEAGEAVEPQPTRPLPAEASPPAQEAERRQLTVMFCDLVDSTALSAQLDPEDLRSMVSAYQEVCATAIQRFGGSIAQYLGDGIVAYFGYPTAHEDDARRAVRAGLGILGGLEDLNLRLAGEEGVRLSLRIGIHTGLVVVGEIGSGRRREHLALGETPNIAARVQSHAPPDTLVVTDATHALITGYFDFHEVSTYEFKGLSKPIGVRRVLRESGAESRLETGASLTPLVGRESEVARLVDAWKRVKEGQGEAVLINGEAGIGKSRLVRVLQEHVAVESHTNLVCRGLPYFQDTALHPLIDLLERTLQIKEGGTAEEKLTKLEAFLRPYPLPFDETVVLFGGLLSIPAPEGRFRPLALTPQAQRQRTLQGVLKLLVEQARWGSVLFVVEDLHWVDASTREFLSLLLATTGVPILTVLTCRPTFQAEWPKGARVTEIKLNPLERDEIEAMVTRLAGGKRLPSELRDRLVNQSDGVPLFVEEMTRAVLDSGLLVESDTGYELRRGTADVGVPATLQDPLMARLDQQTTAKGIAQLGAVIGRSFSYDLIHTLSPLDESTLARQLERLVRADLLHRRGTGPGASFRFKHALIQQAAYESLLKSKRQRYHGEVARALEERFEETVRSQPELLAHHYTQAGLNERAVSYWHRAGERALEGSANVEALSHFRRGLALLAALPPGTSRDRMELRLQLGLAVPLQATTGYTTPEVEGVFERVQALCTEIGDTPERFTALHFLRTFHLLRGDAARALEIGEQLLALAQGADDEELMLEARLSVGGSWFWTGDFETAQRYFDGAIELYDPDRHRGHAVVYGTDPGVQALAYSGWSLWFFGEFDRSERRAREAIELARAIAHPFSEAFSVVYAACLYYFRREPPAAQRWAEEGIEVSGKQGLLWWLALGTILRGWALAAQGRAEEGAPLIRRCLDAMRAMGTELSRPIFLAMLAEAHHGMGETEEGLTCLGEAVDLLKKRGDRSYEAPFVYHAKGELLLALGEARRSEAEQCFEWALRIARHQGARSPQLRTALSLARLQVERDRAETREILSEALRPFADDSETAELNEARALLARL